jgi:hypothetical protein
MLSGQERVRIEKLLASLDEEGLLELRGMVDEAIEALREQAEQEQAETAGPEASSSESKGSGGYIELKYIRGYGPYAYKRFRAGGRLCSEYVGKVKQ